MWVAAHKEQSLGYDIKGIVERASAQWSPYRGSPCEEARVSILVVMGMSTHTCTRPPPPSSASHCTHFRWHKFILPRGTRWLISHHVAAFSTWALKYERGEVCNVRAARAESCALWCGWEEGLAYNSGHATTSRQRYLSGFSRQTWSTDEKQSWPQRGAVHGLWKAPSLTTCTHTVYHLWSAHESMAQHVQAFAEHPHMRWIMRLHAYKYSQNAHDYNMGFRLRFILTLTFLS